MWFTAAVDLDQAMRTTGAARKFVDEAVPHDLLRRVFDRARFAPSGGNRQGWRVVVVSHPASRERLEELSVGGWDEYAAFVKAGRVPFAPGEDGRWHGIPDDVDLDAESPPNEFVTHLSQAPTLAVLLADLTQLAITDIDLDRQSIVGGASVYPFAQNILLSARNEGLGGVFTTFLCRHEAEVKALLSVPDPWVVAGMLALGSVERFPGRLKRKAVDELVRVDHFDGAPLEGGGS